MEALREISMTAKDETGKRVDDPRWRRVNRLMRLHGYKPNALIETLHMVQDTFGFLEMEPLKYVAQTLQVPLSRVYAVATFYHFFTLKPPGRHTCVVCMGTACYVKGADKVLEVTKGVLGENPEEVIDKGKKIFEEGEKVIDDASERAVGRHARRRPSSRCT